MDRDLRSFGQQIREIRRARDWSQEEFSVALNEAGLPVNEAYVNEIEQDRVDLRKQPQVVETIASVLELQIAELTELAMRFDAVTQRQTKDYFSVSSGVMAFRRSQQRR